jgi:hypothetical protein
MSVGKTPKSLLRLATVACALTSETGAPVVCASDSDLLPAGAAAEQATAAPANSATTWWFIGGLGILIAALAGAALIVIRRRRVAGGHKVGTPRVTNTAPVQPR